jgi:hypothetical protein
MIELEAIAIDKPDSSMGAEKGNREHFQEVATNLNCWADLGLNFEWWCGGTLIIFLNLRDAWVQPGSCLGFLRGLPVADV